MLDGLSDAAAPGRFVGCGRVSVPLEPVGSSGTRNTTRSTCLFGGVDPAEPPLGTGVPNREASFSSDAFLSELEASGGGVINDRGYVRSQGGVSDMVQPVTNNITNTMPSARGLVVNACNLIFLNTATSFPNHRLYQRPNSTCIA